MIDIWLYKFLGTGNIRFEISDIREPIYSQYPQLSHLVAWHLQPCNTSTRTKRSGPQFSAADQSEDPTRIGQPYPCHEELHFNYLSFRFPQPSFWCSTWNHRGWCTRKTGCLSCSSFSAPPGRPGAKEIWHIIWTISMFLRESARHTHSVSNKNPSN